MPMKGTASIKTKKQEWASCEFLERQGGQCDRREGQKGKDSNGALTQGPQAPELQSNRVSLVFKCILKSSVLEK